MKWDTVWQIARYILIAVGNAQIKSFFETLFTNLSALATKASGSASPPAGGN